MRPAAELRGEVPDLDDAHPVTVLLAEERQAAHPERLIEVHLHPSHLDVGLDLLVHQLLDLGELAVLHLGTVREVEAQMVGGDQRAGLRHMGAEHAAERGVQQVRARVVLAQPLPPRRLDAHRDVLPLVEAALHDAYAVDDELRAAIVRVEELAAAGAPGDRPRVADLAARLRIRGCPVEDHLDLGACRRLAHAREPALGRVDERQDARGRRERVIADELDARDLGGEARVDRRRLGILARPERRARPRALALRRHLGLIRGVGLVGDEPPLVPEDFLGQVPGESVGVVQPEEEFPAERARARDARRPLAPLRLVVLLDQSHAKVEGLREALLLGPHGLLDPGPLGRELRVGVAHEPDHPVHGPPEEWLGEPEQAAVPHGTTHDAPEHVAAPLVRRRHAVRDQERGRARVVGDHLHRDVMLFAGPVRFVGERGDTLDEGREQVGVVVRHLVLHDRGDALEPHPGVDRGLGQPDELPLRVPVELHEDEVPDFDKAVAVLVRTAGRPAGDRRAVVVEDFGARAARAGVAHRPEIVRGRDADDLLLGQAGDLGP